MKRFFLALLTLLSLTPAFAQGFGSPNGVGFPSTGSSNGGGLTSPVLTTQGGTGLTAYTAGDTVYYLSGTTFSKLAKGTAAQFYQMNSGATAPQWSTMSGDATVAAGGAVTIKSSVALAGNPTTTTQSAGDASTKLSTTAFVTTAIANAVAGVNPAVAVTVATTSAANTSGLTYSNGASGVGATFTGSVNTALTIDGVTLTGVGQRVLVKNDTQSPSGAYNGVYSLTQLQTAILPPILTRALDYNQPSDINNTGAIPVVSGTANATTSWLLTSSVTTVGTDALTYTQFSVNPSTVVWGTGNGGTGLSSFTAGDTLYYASGSLLSKLAKGTGLQYYRMNAGATAPEWTSSLPALPSTNNFRLTLTTAVPVTTTDVTAATTMYFTPCNGNHISTYDASVWTDHASAEISLAVPATLHRIYDVFAYYTGGNLTLTTTAWDSGGQTTGTVTGATAASPCVITATNSLSNGDLVFIDGIVGSLGTDSVKGLNGKCVVVTAASGSAFTCEAMNTSGLTYTSGGTFYKVPTSRTTAITMQDGVYCANGALDHRYVGTITTVASGQTEDSAKRRLVYNYTNQKERNLKCVDTTTNWAYAGGYVARASNLNTTAGVGRTEVCIGLQENPLKMERYQMISGSSTDASMGVGIDSNLLNSSDSHGAEVTNPSFSAASAFLRKYPAAGYHFLQNQEVSNANATFWGNYTSTYLNFECATTGAIAQ